MTPQFGHMVGAGKRLGLGAAGVVYAAEWDGAQVAIKLPSESDDCCWKYVRHQLQHEEAVYRYLDRRLEECVGVLQVLVASRCMAWPV